MVLISGDRDGSSAQKSLFSFRPSPILSRRVERRKVSHGEHGNQGDCRNRAIVASLRRDTFWWRPVRLTRFPATGFFQFVPQLLKSPEIFKFTFADEGRPRRFPIVDVQVFVIDVLQQFRKIVQVIELGEALFGIVHMTADLQQSPTQNLTINLKSTSHPRNPQQKNDAPSHHGSVDNGHGVDPVANRDD